MRINWFSPLPPERTDIANFSARVLPPLAHLAAVHAYSPLPGAAPLTDDIPVTTAPDRRLPWLELNFRDYSVFQIGNDDRFHGNILDLMEAHGGVAVMHDANLHETQRMRFVEREKRPDRYLAALALEGGDAAVEAGREMLAGRLSVSELAADYPLIRGTLRGAHGVITHNPTQLPILQEHTAAPITCLPLAYGAPEEWPSVPRRSLDAKEPLQMVAFGFLHGANRRLAEILEAWSRFPSKERLRLTLFGEYDATALRSQLDTLGLSAWVRLLPFLEEPEVRRVLNDAHLVLNLRHPTRGEASGSLLRAWSHALPTFVSHSGYYGTLDPATVVPISVEDEEADLHRHWSRFLKQPDYYFRIGEAGRDRLLRDHTPQAYVENLCAFLESLASRRTAAYLERWTPRMAHTFIAPLHAQSAQTYWKRRVSAEIASWLPPAPGSPTGPAGSR